MKKITILLATLIIVLCSGFGQEDNLSNEFGVHVGATTGLGLSLRHWFNKPGIQITVLPIGTDDLTFVSGALTALYSFKQTKYVRVYGYLGNHLLYNTENKYETQYNVGIGPGFSFGRTVTFNLMFGYGFYDIVNRLNMYPTGEMGLYFRF